MFVALGELPAASWFVELFGGVCAAARKDVVQTSCATSKPTPNQAVEAPNFLLGFDDGFIGCLDLLG